MSMQLDDDQIEIIQEFVTESRDMIEQLEPAIIELGQNSDPETMNAIFRLFHSMKGSAGFLEFTHLTRVAHAAESLLDLVRNNEIDLLPEHVTLFCAACDFSKDALDAVDASFSDDAMSAAADTISAQLHQAIDGSASSTNDLEDITPNASADSAISEPELILSLIHI